MPRKIIILFIFLTASLAMTGCKVQQHFQQTRSAYETAPFEINPPRVEPVMDEDIPGDIRMVTAAIVQKLRQDPAGIPRVSFDPSGVHYTPETSFKYQGFAVTDISINEHWARDTGRDSFTCRLGGIILFADQLGRRAMLDYAADYELFRDKIIIRESTVRPVPPFFPNTRAFIIEGSQLKEIVDQRPDFAEFYAGVVLRAHTMTPTTEERRQHQELQEMSFFQRVRQAPSSERQDNFMVIFVMDRLTPDAELNVMVTKNLHDSNSLARPVYRDFDGWRVAIFGGNFAIDRDGFFARVYYKPARGVLPQGKDQVMVGLFTSEKNYDVPEAPAPGKVQTATQAPSITPAEGPLASGSRVLDLAGRDDAALVQTRLAELGFYNMKVDGLWGPGSRGALQNFQSASGLQPSGEMDMITQFKLFTGTGR